MQRGWEDIFENHSYPSAMCLLGVRLGSWQQGPLLAKLLYQPLNYFLMRQSPHTSTVSPNGCKYFL